MIHAALILLQSVSVPVEPQEVLYPHQVAFERALTPFGPSVPLATLRKQDGVIIDPRTGELFTGVVTERYEGGARKLRRGVKDGRAHGVWMEWYESGTPRYYGEWRDGLGHGTWLYFHENGEIRTRDYAFDDVWNGPSESWNEEGEKTREAIFVGGEETRRSEFGSAQR